MSLPIPEVMAQPFHFTQQQPVAEGIEQTHHTEALYTFGEYAMFVLLWHPEDFDRGLVGRCPVCFTAYGREAEAYGQGAKNLCPACYGTSFENGYRAKIIRPALFTDHDRDNVESRRGSLSTDTVTLETTVDFAMNRGDWVVRANNQRFAAQVMNATVIRSGFGMPADSRSVGAAAVSLHLEDRKSSPAYLVQPTLDSAVRTLLSLPVATHLPPDLAAFEVLHGNLL